MKEGITLIPCLKGADVAERRRDPAMPGTPQGPGSTHAAYGMFMKNVGFTDA